MGKSLSYGKKSINILCFVSKLGKKWIFTAWPTARAIIATRWCFISLNKWWNNVIVRFFLGLPISLRALDVNIIYFSTLFCQIFLNYARTIIITTDSFNLKTCNTNKWIETSRRLNWMKNILKLMCCAIQGLYVMTKCKTKYYQILRTSSYTIFW